MLFELVATLPLLPSCLTHNFRPPALSLSLSPPHKQTSAQNARCAFQTLDHMAVHANTHLAPSLCLERCVVWMRRMRGHTHSERDGRESVCVLQGGRCFWRWLPFLLRALMKRLHPLLCCLEIAHWAFLGTTKGTTMQLPTYLPCLCCIGIKILSSYLILGPLIYVWFFQFGIVKCIFYILVGIRVFLFQILNCKIWWNFPKF
jgi:hypothetical protein